MKGSTARRRSSSAFAGVERGQDFEHHGHHDVHPSGADEGDGAVEIEDGDAGVGRGRAGMNGFDHAMSACDVTFGNRIGSAGSAVNMQRALWPQSGTTVIVCLAPNF